MDICERLTWFLDGELPESEAEAFREHLATCTECQRAMGDYLQIEAAALRVLARRRANAP